MFSIRIYFQLIVYVYPNIIPNVQIWYGWLSFCNLGTSMLYLKKSQYIFYCSTFWTLKQHVPQRSTILFFIIIPHLINKYVHKYSFNRYQPTLNISSKQTTFSKPFATPRLLTVACTISSFQLPTAPLLHTLNFHSCLVQLPVIFILLHLVPTKFNHLYSINRSDLFTYVNTKQKNYNYYKIW